MGLYRLAHELGWSVEELVQRMSMREYLGWVEYFTRIAGPSAPPPIELAQLSANELRSMF